MNVMNLITMWKKAHTCFFPGYHTKALRKLTWPSKPKKSHNTRYNQVKHGCFLSRYFHYHQVWMSPPVYRSIHGKTKWQVHHVLYDYYYVQYKKNGPTSPADEEYGACFLHGPIVFLPASSSCNDWFQKSTLVAGLATTAFANVIISMQDQWPCRVLFCIVYDDVDVSVQISVLKCRRLDTWYPSSG